MLLWIFLLIFLYTISYIPVMEKFKSYKKKLGVIITSYGNNGIFLEHTIKSYLLHVPINTLIIVYVNNCTDFITLNIAPKYPDIIFKFEKNNQYNISKIWNKGIELCLSYNCSNIIISRDDLIFTDCIKNMIIYNFRQADSKRCFVPSVNCRNDKDHQHYDYYGNNLLENNFPIKECLIIFNSKSLIDNKYKKNREFFNVLHQHRQTSLHDWISRFNHLGGKCMIFTNTFVYCYYRNNVNFNNTRCLYMINTGNYEGDKLNLNNNNNKYNCDVILFTDNIEQIKDCYNKNVIPFYTFNNSFQDPQKLQRFIKTAPHIWLPSEYDISIYIDGNVLLTIPDTLTLVNMFLGKYDLVCWKHPTRTTILDEANEIINTKLAQPYSVIKILEIMNDNSFQDNVGLTETNILIRRHKNIIPFSNKWSDLVNICRRDQISFDYLLQKFHINHKKYDFKTKPSIKFKHILGLNRYIN